MKTLIAIAAFILWVFAAGFLCGTYNTPYETPHECVKTTYNTGLAYQYMVQEQGREMVRTAGGGWCVRQSRVG